MADELEGGIGRVDDRIRQRAQGEVEARVSLAEELYGLLGLVLILGERSLYGRGSLGGELDREQRIA